MKKNNEELHGNISRDPDENEHPILMVRRSLIRDKFLTNEQLGFLIYLQCESENSKITPREICINRNMSESKYMTMVNDLIKYGYLERI